ncbi:MAG: chemotaxis protein CheW [Bdellovibrio sp.]|nr:chemotaxis protein CheW [Bdellovibrio sp.]
MSDFFGDDFTAELKKYFLDATLKEVEKFVDLVDESTMKRLRPEIKEQATSWTVDAKSNEFAGLAQWLEDFTEKMDLLDQPESLHKVLQLLRKYLETLLVDAKDSVELAAQFTIHAQSSKESLFLHCRTGTQEFVVPILNVIEISGTLPLYPLPEKREGLAGVIPFRGEAIPVFSLNEYGFQKLDAKQHYFVICEFEGARFSLQVTETDELISLKDRELQSMETHPAMIAVPFIRNFFIKDQRSVMVLDLEKLVAA